MHGTTLKDSSHSLIKLGRSGIPGSEPEQVMSRAGRTREATQKMQSRQTGSWNSSEGEAKTESVLV